MRKEGSRTTSRWVHTSGVSNTDKALWDEAQTKANGDTAGGRVKQLESWSKPLPSQVLTFQRGLARAALEQIPDERERAEALAEVLSMMNILDRFHKVEL